MTTETKKFQEPNEKEIAEYAYHLWESEGRIAGRDLDYWLQAKTHLTTARQDEAGLLKTVDPQKTDEGRSQQTDSSRTTVPPARKLRKKKQARQVQEPAYAY